jgi:hypothetical protein
MKMTTRQDVESLAAKLEAFAKGLSPDERDLFLSLLPSAAPPGGELSESDLEKVSGGTFFGGDFVAAVLRGTQSSSLSSVMKTKHDTVKNSISNVR